MEAINLIVAIQETVKVKWIEFKSFSECKEIANDLCDDKDALEAFTLDYLSTFN